MDGRAYMGQTVFWPKIGPITMDFDETRGDLIPPMRPRIWSGSRGRGGQKLRPDPDPGGVETPRGEKGGSPHPPLKVDLLKGLGKL